VFKKILNWVLRLIAYLILASVVFLGAARLITTLYARSRVYDVASVPAKRAAVVFGAGLWRDGSPTPILRDRVKAAALLYFSGKVEKLLMSGDNRFLDYNEPGAMRQYALQLGVPDDAIVLDYAGRRTYDTCFRAKAIFGLNDVILVTQKFHLPRAIFTCNMLGMNTIGVDADLQSYRRSSVIYWNVRELLANFGALIDIYILRPLPVLGSPEPIFPETTAR
jgi:SanA protein